MDNIFRRSMDDSLNQMEKAFLHLATVPEEQPFVTQFLEALNEAKGLLADDAKEEINENS
jgi:hypothetical protein